MSPRLWGGRGCTDTTPPRPTLGVKKGDCGIRGHGGSRLRQSVLRGVSSAESEPPASPNSHTTQKLVTHRPSPKGSSRMGAPRPKGSTLKKSSLTVRPPTSTLRGAPRTGSAPLPRELHTMTLQCMFMYSQVYNVPSCPKGQPPSGASTRCFGGWPG